MTDEELARSASTGNAVAFNQLVNRHAPACLRFSTRMLGNAADAEEATQDSFVRAHRALPRYDSQVAFRTWLFAILVNRCRTLQAKRARRERHEQVDPIALKGALSRADEGELRIELARAIARLPDDQREVFLLKHVEQLEYAEITSILDVGISALKMRVQRACQQLRIELRDYDDTRT